MALNSLNPLSYLGVDPQTPVQVIVNTHNPGERDNKFNLGTIWVNKSSQSAWILADLSNKIATWFQFAVGGSGATDFVTDSGTATISDETINILSNASPAATSGINSTVTDTLSNGTNGQLIIGGGANPTWASITSSDNTVTITEGPNSLDLTLSPALTTINADSGFAQPAGGEVNIVGNSNVLSTSGSSNNVTTTLSNGTNGQLLIGGGSDPTYANVTSSGSTIDITNGANTLNLEVGAVAPTSFITDSGTAIPAANVLNVLGDANDVITMASGDEFLMIGLKNYAGIVSFTPSLSFGTTTPSGLTYATRFGFYARAGNALYMNLYIELSSKGTGGAGFVNIVGPPISFFNVTSFFLRVENITLIAGNNGLNCFGVTSGATLRMTEPAGATGSNITWNELTNSSVIHMSGVLI